MRTSKISWTDTTWEIVTGCTRVSEGCRNCFAERMVATRLKHFPQTKGLAVMRNGDAHWTGKVRCHPELLDKPLFWPKPRRVFVCSRSDLFHEKVPTEFLRDAFRVMYQCEQHVFQLLTKRPLLALHHVVNYESSQELPANIWLGTSIENQAAHDERVPYLRRVPAAVRWFSVEPLLGPIKLDLDGIHWVVVGGESGPGARPMDLEWASSIRDQCAAAMVAFYMKQIVEAGRKVPFDEWPEDLKIREYPQ